MYVKYLCSILLVFSTTDSDFLGRIPNGTNVPLKSL